MPPVVIFGCGFTGAEVAKSLLLRGVQVFATSRSPAKLAYLARAGVSIHKLDLADFHPLESLPSNPLVLHSIPDISDGERERFREYLTQLKPARVVYLSSTSVYGDQVQVDANTSEAPSDEKSERRVLEEQFVRGGHWSSLVLRPAAIYGAHRGIHTQVRAGNKPKIRSGIVSRIHVRDLAFHAELALLGDQEGNFPVADEYPSTSREIVDYCRFLLGVPPDHPACLGSSEEGSERSGRRVDSSTIQELLGVKLLYPEFQSGVLASLMEEMTALPGT